MNKVYEKLDTVGFLKKGYLPKFMFVAFVGIHIPLLAIIALMVYNQQITKSSVFIVVLLFTLIATALTLHLLRKLLTPLLIAKKTLDNYIRYQSLPLKQREFKDEAGQLLKTINESVHIFDETMREKEQITGLLSHNLRIPFSQIKALTEVLSQQKGLKNNNEIELINLICNNQLKNSDELFKNLSMKSNENEKSDVNIEQLIENHIQAADNQLKNKKLSVQCEYDPVSNLVSSNEQKLSLIFENILNNAIKFSFLGKGIYIRCRRDDNQYIISVRDEGIGFPLEYRDKIFSPNANIGRVGTMGEPTNGIGLSLSKKNIQKLGGDLRAFSEGDFKGAEFTIIISTD